MLELDLALDWPLDLSLTLRPLVRGQGDRTIRLAPGRAVWTTRTADGLATLVFKQDGDRLHVAAHGPGADRALERASRVVGVDAESTGLRDLMSVEDRRIGRLVVVPTHVVDR